MKPLSTPALVAPLLAALLLGGCVTERPQPQQTVGTELPKSEASKPLAAFAMTAPQWLPGEQWTYSDGYGMAVAEVKGEVAKFQRLDDPTQWFVSRGPFREQLQSRAAHRELVYRSDDPTRLYQAGLRQPVVFVREYSRNGQLVRHNTSWTIEGYERVTVPAGTFDTVILVMRTRSLTGNWLGHERWWYSPQAKNYVRMEYKYGEAPESARVLTAYQTKS